MTTLIESLATAVLLILFVLLLSHIINGTATSWIGSKFKAQ
jgi:hypothetical protein